MIDNNRFFSSILCLSLWAADTSAVDLEYAGFEADVRYLIPTRTGVRDTAVLTIEPELELVIGSARLSVRGRLRTDLAVLQPGEPRQRSRSSYNRRANLSNQSTAEIREFFLDVSLAGIDLRLGKQQLVWGQADGLKVLDVLNPTDFREFILEPFEDSRIPLWALRTSRHFGNLSTELIWTLDASAHELPGPMDQFTFSAARFSQPDPALVDQQRPPGGLPGSEIGVRLSGNFGRADLAVMLHSRYSDLPTYRLGLASDNRVVLARYGREKLVGLSMALSAGDWVFRSEVGYSPDRATTRADLSLRSTLRAKTLASVVGADWLGRAGLFVSAQWFIDHRLERIGSRDPRRTDRFLTLALRKPFLNETLRLEFTGLFNTRDRDYLLRPRISYQLNDQFTIALGADLFGGTARGVFGQFRNVSRTFFEIAWGFGS